MSTGGLCPGMAALAIAALLTTNAAPVRAQSADPAIRIGDSDVGGVCLTAR